MFTEHRDRSWRTGWLLSFLCTLLAGTAYAQSASNGSPSVGEYLIGPGDSLQVFVWRQPELSVTVPVRPDGRISIPLVDDLEAVGKTPTQLAQEIENVLSEFIRQPEVNVIVQSFVGTFGAQIRVLGQAVQPRAIPYRERMTVMDVVIEAGGLTEFAAGNRSRIVRTVDGKTQEIRVKLDDLIKRGRLRENIPVQPGDVLIIPEAIF
jgi:polysaccharide export outer membrane protein